ncbi:MAG: PKD-like domain-containing protein [Flavobacteriales bacterium]
MENYRLKLPSSVLNKAVIIVLFLSGFLVKSSSYSQCPNFTVFLGNDQPFCANQSVDIIAQVNDTSGFPQSFVWSLNGSVLSGSDDTLSIFLTSSSQGNYVVSVTIDSCVVHDTIVLALLNPGSINGDQLICANQVPNIFNSIAPATIVSGDSLFYEWESSTDSISWSSFTGSNSLNFMSGSLTQTTYFRRRVEVIKNNVTTCFSYSNVILVKVINGVTLDAGFDTTVCPKNSFTFTSSVSGQGSSQPVFSWSGPNGFSDTVLSPTISSVALIDAGTYILSATIGNCILYDTIVLDVYNIDISSGQFNSAKTQLVDCIGPSNSSGAIGIFLNLPSNLSLVQSVSIDWGDGVVQSVAASNYSGIKIHSYAAGSYTLTVTVQLTSGCTTVLDYSVFVGSSPSPASLALFVNQANGCLPHSTSFTFNVPTSNVNGTTYIVDWGDGSPTVVYTHPNTPPVLNHVYSQSSCGSQVTLSGTTYNNVYQPFVITQNPCSNQPQPSAAGLISVGIPPEALFTVSKEVICPNEEIEFFNTSDFGVAIPNGNGASCDSAAPYYWTITPANSTTPVSWSVVSGSLGSNSGYPGNPSFWQQGSINPKVEFFVSGTYIMDLIVENACGQSIYSDTICVIVPPICAIAAIDTVGCSMLRTGLASNSIIPTCDSFDLPVQYNWSITDPTGCVGCSSSVLNANSDSTGVVLVNNSNSIQYFNVDLTITAIDSTLNRLLSICKSSCTQTIKVYPKAKISPLTSCKGQLNWNLTNQVNVPSTITWQATPNPNVSGETTSLQTSNLITDSLVNISSTSQTVIYTVIAISIDGGCSDTQIFTVNLLAPIEVQPLPDDTICVGGTIASPLVLNYVGGTNSPTYQWLQGGLGVSNNPSFTPTTFNTPGNYSFVGSVTVGPAGCLVSDSDTFTITVVPDPFVTLQPLSDTYCLGTLDIDTLVVSASGGLGSYSYQWHSSAINSNSGGTAIPGATSASYLPSLASVGTVYYYCEITQVGLNCNVSSATAAIVVTPAPTFITQPITTQTICLDGALSTLTVAYQNGVAGGTYQWYSNTSNSPSGGTLISGATNPSYSPSSNSVGTFYYYCVVTLPSGGCNSITSNVGAVIIRPEATINIQPLSNQLICEGGTIGTALFVGYSGGVGTPNYQWQRDGLNISSANDSFYLPPSFNSSDTVEFSVIINLSGAGCNADTSQSGEVIVIEDPTITRQPDTAVYCQNASPVTSLVVQAAGGLGTYTYQWYMDSVKSTYSASQLIPGATDSAFVPFVDSVGVFYYYCVISQTGLNCGVVSDTVKITITQGPSFLTQPMDSQIVCLDGNLIPLTVSYQNGVVGGTFQWYSNSVNSKTGGTAISGATNSSYLPPNNLVGNYYYYCTVSLPSGGCSSITSEVSTVVIKPDPIIVIQPFLNQIICEGGTIDTALFVGYSGGVGAASYQWQKMGVDIPGATDSFYLPPLFPSSDTVDFSVQVSLNGSGCDADTSQVGRVIILDDPVITLQPDSAVYCENASQVDTLIISASGGLGTKRFQWYSSFTNTNFGGTLISGATDSTYVPLVGSASDRYYYCVVTQTGSNCGVASLPARIFVTPGPTFLTQPIDTQIVCIDGSFLPLSVNYFNGFGQPSYQWYSNSINSSFGGTALIGDTNSSYTPSSSVSGVKYYYCEITFNSGGCSKITSEIGVAIVRTEPTINVQPLSNDTICVGGTISPALSLNYTGGAGIPSYQWQEFGLDISGATASTFTPQNFSTSGNYLFTVVLSLSGSGCESDTSQDAFVTVVPDPVVSAQPLSDTYCLNSSNIDSLYVSATGGLGSFIYQWYQNSSNSNIGGSLIPGATDSLYLPTANTLGAVYYYCELTQTGLNCSTVSAVAEILVTPSPTFSTQPIDSQTICLNGTLSPLSVAYQNGVFGGTYQWFKNSINSNNGGIAMLGETNISYNPPTNQIGSFYYYCEVTLPSGGCSSITSNVGKVTIVGHPVLSVQPLPSQTICIGGTISSALNVGFSGGIGSPSYQWMRSGVNIPGANSQSFTPNVSSLILGNNEFSVVLFLSGSGCLNDTSQSASIIVISDPIVSLQPISDTYCLNSPGVDSLKVIATGGLGNYNYQWYSNSSNSSLGGTPITGANSSSYLPPVTAVGSIFYYCLITQTGQNCDVTSVAAEIKVTPSPTFSLQPIDSQSVCLDGMISALSVAYQNGVSGGTYQWFKNTINSYTGGSAVTGQTNSSFVPNSDSIGIFYYYCVVSLPSGGCASITSEISKVEVVSDPIVLVQPIPNQTICEGGTISTALIVSYSGGIGLPSYQWFNSGVPVSGANSSSFIPTGVNFPGVYDYNVEITLNGAGCNSDTSQIAKITVISDPIVTVQPLSDTYCLGAFPVDTLHVSATGGLGTYNYQWYSNVSNSSTGGLIITGATDSTFIPPVSSVGTLFYYCEIKQTGFNCNVTTSVAGIIVNPAPTFTTQPLDSQKVCLDGVLLPLQVAYQNGAGTPAYKWYVNSSNSYSGATLIPGAVNPTFTPLAANVGTNYYFCEISLSKGGCSSIFSVISKVTVSPDPIISLHPVPLHSICIGGTIASPLTITYQNGVGLPSYQWQKNGVDLIGETNSSFLPTTFFVVDTVQFSVILNLSGSGCNSDTSQLSTVIVVDDPVMVIQPDSAIYCQNITPVTPLLVRASGGLGSFNYQWYSNSAGSNTGGILIPGATDSTYTPPVNAVGTIYYYCEITQSGLNCSVISSASQIITTPSPSFSNQPLGFQKLCIGGVASPLTVSYVGGNSSVSYQWYENSINSNIGGSPLTGETSNTCFPATNTSGIKYYYCVVSFSVGGCSNIISNPAEVETVDDPRITNQPITSQMICEGTTTAVPLSFSYTGGTGSTSIAWYEFATPGVLINGVTDTSFLPITFNTAGNYKYFAIVTDSGRGCDNAISLNSEIIVNPTPFVNQLDDTVICNDSRLNINISTSIPSNINWSATQNFNVTGELTSTQTSFLIDDSLTNNTNISQLVNYSITPTSFPHGCPGPDSIVTVKVQPDVILSNVPNVEICSGSPVNSILSANIPATFRWFVSIDNPNVTGESLLPSTSNIITDRLINNTSVNQIVVYSVFPVSIEGNCQGLVQTFVVTVKPSLILLNEDTVTICSGTRVNLALVANTNVTFNWYADQSVNVLNETTSVVSSAFINDSLVNVGNSVEEVTYHVAGTSTANGCSSPVIPITVFVNPIPSIFPIADTVVCNGVTLSPISFNGPVVGTRYSWTVTDTSVGVGVGNGLNSIPGFITSNTTLATKSTRFTANPIFVNDSVFCAGPTESFILNVLPSPDVNTLSDIDVCDGIQVPQTLVSGSVPGTIFNWQNSNTSISLNSGGIGNIPSFNASNLSGVQQFSTVSVFPMIQMSGVQCLGLPKTYLITVNPTPQLMNSNIEICSGEKTNIVLNANIPSSFQWSATPTPTVFNETSFPIQSSSLINDSLTINSLFAQFVDYRVTPTSIPYGCVGPDSVVQVKVNPIPLIDYSILNTTFCDLQPVNFLNNSLGSLNFQWNFGDGNNSVFVNTSNIYSSPGRYSITLKGADPLTGCSDSVSKPIVISQTPSSQYSYSDSVGCDFLNVIFTADTTNTDWDYAWNFGDGNNSTQFGVAGNFYNQIGCNDVTLEVTSKSGCVSTTLDTNAICVYEKPIAKFSSDRKVFSSLENPIVQFVNQSLFSSIYFWDFGDGQTSIAQSPVNIYPEGAAAYRVKLYASNLIGCVDSTSKLITVFQDIAIYVPNAFTPNKDMINQVFLPVLTDGFIEETYHLTIYNRWGELVFESRDPEVGWDGLCGNDASDKGCPVGSYVWKLSIAVEKSSEMKLYMGHVNLLR